MKLKLYQFVSFTLILASFTSCKVEPKEIKYGEDHCHFCDMTVVDKTHAAEYVTKKGKAYMFDAIECMVRDLDRNSDETNMAFLLVSDYENPGVLVAAQDATYLISVKIKSPMGANLTAFGSQEVAKTTQVDLGGKLYNWEELKVQFAK